MLSGKLRRPANLIEVELASSLIAHLASMENSQEEVVYGSDATETTHEGSTGSQDVSTARRNVEGAVASVECLSSMLEHLACTSEAIMAESNRIRTKLSREGSDETDGNQFPTVSVMSATTGPLLTVPDSDIRFEFREVSVSSKVAFHNISLGNVSYLAGHVGKS